MQDKRLFVLERNAFNILLVLLLLLLLLLAAHRADTKLDLNNLGLLTSTTNCPNYR